MTARLAPRSYKHNHSLAEGNRSVDRKTNMADAPRILGTAFLSVGSTNHECVLCRETHATLHTCQEQLVISAGQAPFQLDLVQQFNVSHVTNADESLRGGGGIAQGVDWLAFAQGAECCRKYLVARAVFVETDECFGEDRQLDVLCNILLLKGCVRCCCILL